MLHTRTIPKSVGKQGSRGSGGTGVGGQLGTTSAGVWAGNTPRLLSTVWQELGCVGGTTLSHCQLALSTVPQTQGKPRPPSLGPATDPCLTSSLSPGGSCLEALGATAGRPRSCCTDPINCALLGGKTCRSEKGAQVLCPGPGPPQSITRQGIGDDHERGERRGG